MNVARFKSHFRQYGGITAVVVFALVIRGRYSLIRPPLWDSSVYILMGKYLFSGGQIGLIEPFRPLAWPLGLGSLWKIGLEPILWGRILQVFFSLGNIFLVYLIGLRLFDKKTALLAGLFLAVSPSFFIGGNCLYPGVPASFFGLLGFWLSLAGRPFLSGLSCLLAFHTKFIQAIPAAFTGFRQILADDRRRKLPGFGRWILGAALAGALFLLTFHVLYGHVLKPFYEGMDVYRQDETSLIAGLAETLGVLITRESLFFIFFPAGLFSFKKRSRADRRIIWMTGLAAVLAIAKLPTDILRFSIASLPYLYLSTANGIFVLVSRLQPRLRRAPGLLAVIFLVCLLLQFPRLSDIRFAERPPDIFQQYITANEDSINGLIWISDPSMVVYSGLKADMLMYYPVVNARKFAELKDNLERADWVFYNGLTLKCRPAGDLVCEERKDAFFKALERDFTAVFRYTNPVMDGMRIGIFRRRVPDGT